MNFYKKSTQRVFTIVIVSVVVLALVISVFASLI